MDGMLRERQFLVDYLVDLLLRKQTHSLTHKALAELLAQQQLLHEYFSLPESGRSSFSFEPEQIRKKARTGDVFLSLKKKGGAGSGIEMQSVKEGNVCIITQKEICVPVKAPCGHIFEKEGLCFLHNQAKLAGKRFHCPHLGCESNWQKQGFTPK